jgi:Leucine-rich repeat (LRR) protein
LQDLYLSGPQITDEGIKELAGLKNLQTLHLTFTKVTHVGLKSLAGLQELQSLNLSGAQVTDAALKALAGFRKMQTLGLAAGRFTDDGLKELARLKNLHYVDLSFTKVTGTGVAELQKALPELEIYQMDKRTNSRRAGKFRETEARWNRPGPPSSSALPSPDCCCSCMWPRCASSLQRSGCRGLASNFICRIFPTRDWRFF